jgi:sensor c-di-GMP phosphodiesterase-like protein
MLISLRVLPMPNDPTKRIPLPYGEFLPEDERSSSHMGLIIAAIILLLASIAMLYLNLRDGLVTPFDHVRRFSEAEIREKYDENLSLLENTQQNLKELRTYVESQSRLVQSTHQLLTEMQERRDRLKPILETEVEAVNALFQAQEERLRRERWRDTAISFVLGVLASLSATYLWEFFRRRRKRSHKMPSPPLPVE